MNKAFYLLVFVASAQAGTFRCDERSGTIRYQNESCPDGSLQQQLRSVTPPPPELFVPPPSQEIPARMPVRVIPVINEDFAPVESASSGRGERRRR